MNPNILFIYSVLEIDCSWLVVLFSQKDKLETQGNILFYILSSSPKILNLGPDKHVKCPLNCLPRLFSFASYRKVWF